MEEQNNWQMRFPAPNVDIFVNQEGNNILLFCSQNWAPIIFSLKLIRCSGQCKQKYLKCAQLPCFVRWYIIRIELSCEGKYAHWMQRDIQAYFSSSSGAKYLQQAGVSRKLWKSKSFAIYRKLLPFNIPRKISGKFWSCRPHLLAICGTHRLYCKKYTNCLC